MRLTVHPDHPARGVRGVSVEIARRGPLLQLRYWVQGEVAGLIDAGGVGRTDELWRHTCFEAFVTGGDGYFEFNFAPSGAWAAYAFDAYRAGMRDASAAPHMAWDGSTLTAETEVAVAGDWRLNVSAVIEEADGSKSYWALAHPDGPPDFHDPACFVLELPAPR